jgi:catechol 2,3-dioxygenase-like lactoylglutathione lyase family enzyme
MTRDFPSADVVVTLLRVVADVERSTRFYRDVLGATVYREYGGTSCVLQFQGTWLLLTTGGEPTADKPTVVFAPPADPDVVSHELTLRVLIARELTRLFGPGARHSSRLRSPTSGRSECSCGTLTAT